MTSINEVISILESRGIEDISSQKDILSVMVSDIIREINVYPAFETNKTTVTFDCNGITKAPNGFVKLIEYGSAHGIRIQYQLGKLRCNAPNVSSEIEYRSIPVDCDGFPVVDDIIREAVLVGLEYRYLLTKSKAKKGNEFMLNNLKNEYKELVSIARGNANEFTRNDWYNIARNRT